MNGDGDGAERWRIERSVYGGEGLARKSTGETVFVPFALPGELVQLEEDPTPEAILSTGGHGPQTQLRVLEPSPDRADPRCIHFTVCGGCQYQMAAYSAQIALKEAILCELFQRAGLDVLAGTDSDPALLSSTRVPVHSWPSPEPWGYRNRVRLRVRRVRGEIRLGYNVRASNDFLPITMCPIAAPLLWRAAEALMAAGASTDRDATRWLEAASEVELFCDSEQTRLQITLLCATAPPFKAASFEAAARAFRALCPELAGVGAVRIDPRSHRTLESVAGWGAPGILYRVRDEEYWITRGAFFQVNRFLLPTLVDLVCGGRSGLLAWDLFSGVGLFSRILARSFSSVTAVEANPTAAADLRRALARLGPHHRAIQATTVEFLRKAVLERDRPELIVLDPPRAGAGEEVCRLLARASPREIVYLSCDPTTLTRDLAVLTAWGYGISAVHLVDLFPQTYHLEAMVVLRPT